MAEILMGGEYISEEGYSRLMAIKHIIDNYSLSLERQPDTVFETSFDPYLLEYIGEFAIDALRRHNGLITGVDGGVVRAIEEETTRRREGTSDAPSYIAQSIDELKMISEFIEMGDLLSQSDFDLAYTARDDDGVVRIKNKFGKTVIPTQHIA